MSNPAVSVFQTLPRTIGEKAEPLFSLLVRVVIGVALAQTGWGKLHNLEGVTQFFESLGIPAPGINAAFIGGLEFVGGIALVAGFCTRFFAALLSAAMVVATLTGEKDVFAQYLANEKSFTDVAAFAYLLILLLLWAHGAGLLSVDALLSKRAPAPPRP